MRITPFGAAREVTGSCHLIETKHTRLLIDCGMFQGSAFNDAKNFQPFGFHPAELDAVVITHSHLDHVGRLPKLVAEGFQGQIFMTKPTIEMSRVVLEDACEIMQEAFERDFRPKLYEVEDLSKTLEHMRGMDYSRWKTVGDLRFRLRDAGHIFGSAFIEVEEKDGVRAVFSGDIGNIDIPILRPTAQMESADVVFLESTYGNRVHEDASTRSQLFHDVVERTIKTKGVLLIPAFAIERTQALIYDLNRMIEEKTIPPIDVYLDSPMAIKITEIMKEYPEYYDAEAAKLVMHGDDFLDFSGLTLTRTRSESKKINNSPPPKIIIAGAGMMNGGRITHHLLRYLSNPNTTLLIVGYQASGTLGQKLYAGEKSVRILDEVVHVKARVESIGSFSAHGDQHKLLDWIRGAETLPKKVYCVHGENDACVALATEIKENFHIFADAPRSGEAITIA